MKTDDHKLSQSLEDYLEAVYLISIEKKVVRVKDLVQKLGVRSSSVIGAIKKLRDKELIIQEHYGYINLTGKGKKEATQIYEKHSSLFNFFYKLLDVDRKTAEADACSIEHHISNESLNQILKLTKIFENRKDEDKLSIKAVREEISRKSSFVKFS